MQFIVVQRNLQGGDRARATPHRKSNAVSHQAIRLSSRSKTAPTEIVFLRLVSEACPLPALHLRSRPSDVRSNRLRAGKGIRQFVNPMEVRYGHARHNNRNARPESAACSTQRRRYAEAFRDDRRRCLAAGTRAVPLPRDKATG